MREVKVMMSAAAAEEEVEECENFSMEELTAAIKEMKAKGAAGPDLVSPRFIKALGPKALDWLLWCINRAWAGGTVPQEWQNATIVPLLKAGKPASSMDSYRPVA